MIFNSDTKTYSLKELPSEYNVAAKKAIKEMAVFIIENMGIPLTKEQIDIEEKYVKENMRFIIHDSFLYIGT
jgi:hypothetical protein